MSFGEGNLRERVAELEREVAHWKDILRVLWCDLFATNSIVATVWVKACRELREELTETVADKYAERIRELMTLSENDRDNHGGDANADFISDSYTCEDVSTEYGTFICSECGCRVDEGCVDNGGVNFCPDCGREVER